MWLRKVQVIITNANDLSKKTIFQDHAIEFEIKSSIGWASDIATVNLYNLSISEIKALQVKNPKDLLIEIRASYSDALSAGTVLDNGGESNYNKGDAIPIREGPVLPTIFSGVIKNTIGYKRLTEHITTLYCMTKASYNSSVFVQMKAIPPGTSLRQTLKSMCEDYGYHNISTFGVTNEELDTALPTGRTFNKTFVDEMDALLHEHNMQFYISTSEIQVFSNTYGDPDAVRRMKESRKPIQIDANSVIGNPVAGVAVFNLDVFLNHEIQPGMIIDVSPLLGSEILANGVVSVSNQQQILNYADAVYRFAISSEYLVLSIIHKGNTHGQEFTTSIYGVKGGDNATGHDESDWQNTGN